MQLKSEVLRNPDWPQASNPPASISQVLRSQTYPLNSFKWTLYWDFEEQMLVWQSAMVWILTGESSSLSLDTEYFTLTPTNDACSWLLHSESVSVTDGCVPWIVLGPWLFWVGCTNLFLFPIPLVLILPARYLVLGKVWWYTPSINSPQEDRSVSPRPVRRYGGPV